MEGLNLRTDWHQFQLVVVRDAYVFKRPRQGGSPGAVARTSFFVLYSVLKEHLPPSREPLVAHDPEGPLVPGLRALSRSAGPRGGLAL